MSDFSLAEAVKSQASIGDIAAALNTMTHDQRLAEMAPFGGRLQGQLFELASGRVTEPEFYLGEESADVEVIHWGRNFAPLFNRFQKRFAKVGDELVGYNEQSMKAFTGPGHFVGELLTNPEGERQFAINYTKTPKRSLPEWPAVVPSGVRLGRFVYGGAHDWMWRVSDHMSIGRVHKGGRWQDQWFLLNRQG